MVSFIFGYAAAGITFLIYKIGSSYYRDYLYNQEVKRNNINRKKAYDREVAEGRMKTDGDGTYWKVD